MAKIAVELERALANRARSGGPGTPTVRVLAQGEGWTVEDVICTSGSRDRAFEERHSRVSVAIVAAGSFQYNRDLMTPGSLLLGNAGQCFECAHHHGAGDRCVSFGYTPAYFEKLAEADPRFSALRIPPLRDLSPLVARALAGLAGSKAIAWEELSASLAVRALQISSGVTAKDPSASAVARVTRVVRMIDDDPACSHTLADLARHAALSPYHFLRTFQQVTGVTPHQYILRARLREAALRLSGRRSILEVALSSGFNDLSNFNRTFRTEFGLTPRSFRAG